LPVDMRTLVADLAGETAEIKVLLSGLDETGWRAPTPATGWTIADQVTHLAFFDDAAVITATDPERFARELGDAATAASPDDIAARYRALTGIETLDWFAASRQRLIEVFGSIDPATRLPWFGPPMSAASAATARIMETWAHGQDIADTLAVTRVPTSRLRHVAHIGVRALPFSFMVHGLNVPAEAVTVELTGTDGELWTWGHDAGADRVTGPALDFCLLVTQRRHREDTSLAASGAIADQWLDIAQAFAGPPGPGRRPGQHNSTDKISDEKAL
jgi:uncharacterized protein (TIGR03084 family)